MPFNKNRFTLHVSSFVSWLSALKCGWFFCHLLYRMGMKTYKGNIEGLLQTGELGVTGARGAGTRHGGAADRHREVRNSLFYSTTIQTYIKP